jgi:hypothetical protein
VSTIGAPTTLKNIFFDSVSLTRELTIVLVDPVPISAFLYSAQQLIFDTSFVYDSAAIFSASDIVG